MPLYKIPQQSLGKPGRVIVITQNLSIFTYSFVRQALLNTYSLQSIKTVLMYPGEENRSQFLPSWS